MALMTPQAVSPVITPEFTAPSVSDTIKPDEGLLLYVKNGATATTVTVLVPGNQPYSGIATSDLTQTFTSSERLFYLPPFIADPSSGLITVTYSSVATVTAALIKV